MKDRGYDILGNIVIVKFDRESGLADKKRIARALLKQNKNITTVLEKSSRFKGRLRTQKTKHILGLRTKESLYRENACEFLFDVDECYFSPRLASERKEIASLVKKGEQVLVMFGGVAPFAIVIAKLSRARRVVSVELSKECSKYALLNVKRNKLSNVEIVQGDVRKVIGARGRVKEKFDRIVMARPNLDDIFLDVAFRAIKRSGVIHYYGFYPENESEKLKELIFNEAIKAKKKVKIIRVKKAGDIGMRKFRYRADIKVLN